MFEHTTRFDLGNSVWFVNENTEIVKAVVIRILISGRHPKNINYELSNFEYYTEPFLFSSRQELIDCLLSKSPTE